MALRTSDSDGRAGWLAGLRGAARLGRLEEAEIRVASPCVVCLFKQRAQTAEVVMR